MTNVHFDRGSLSKFEELSDASLQGGIFKITATDASISEDYEQHRLYIDDTLMGDAYVTNEKSDSITTSTVGRIAKGTAIRDLMKESNGSVSKLIDMILFGTDASTPDASTLDTQIIELASYIQQIQQVLDASITPRWEEVGNELENNTEDLVGGDDLLN